MSNSLRILILEDFHPDAELVVEELEVFGFTVDWELVDNEQDFCDRLDSGGWDLILSDYKLPQFDGLRALQQVQARGLDIPFILVSGDIGEEIAVAALKLGAADYLLKDRLARLGPAVNQALQQKRLRDERRQTEEALRESEAHFRRLAENAQDMIYRYRLLPTRAFEYVSPAAITLTGYTPAQHYADADLAFNIVHPADRELWLQLFMKQADLSRPLVLRWIRKDGTLIWIEQRNVPIYDTDGNLVALEGIARDITERQQREQELAAIATVSLALRKAKRRSEILQITLDQIVLLLEATAAVVVMLDPYSQEHVVELAWGAWKQMQGLRVQPGEGISGQVIATGKPYINNDLRSDAHLARPDSSGGIQAAVAAPLFTGEQIIGLLWVGRQSTLNTADLRLLTAVADIAATAIHRVTLHEQTEQQLGRLTTLRAIDQAITASLDLQLTLDILLEHITSQLEVDAVDVLLLNPATLMLEQTARRGFHSNRLLKEDVRLGDGPVGIAALERRIINIADLREAPTTRKPAAWIAEEGFVAYYSLPLIVKGDVKGVLEIYHRAPLQPDPEWLGFLEALAGQVAIAVDNALLFVNMQRSNLELKLAYDTTLEGWSRALDLRDKETEGHTQRVTEITLKLARIMGIEAAQLVHIRRGTLLHDIGKMGVPDHILHKPGPLTAEEWIIMRKHPEYAHDMLVPIAYLRPALDIPYSHHEKWDGGGYPRQLQGEHIPLTARIFAVIDVWDALRSNRPYRPAWTEEKTLAYIQEQAGKHFDPQVVEAFLTAMAKGELEEDRKRLPYDSAPS